MGHHKHRDKKERDYKRYGDIRIYYNPRRDGIRIGRYGGYNINGNYIGYVYNNGFFGNRLYGSDYYGYGFNGY